MSNIILEYIEYYKKNKQKLPLLSELYQLKYPMLVNNTKYEYFQDIIKDYDPVILGNKQRMTRVKSEIVWWENLEDFESLSKLYEKWKNKMIYIPKNNKQIDELMLLAVTQPFLSEKNFKYFRNLANYSDSNQKDEYVTKCIKSNSENMFKILIKEFNMYKNTWITKLLIQYGRKNMLMFYTKFITPQELNFCVKPFKFNPEFFEYIKAYKNYFNSYICYFLIYECILNEVKNKVDYEYYENYKNKLFKLIEMGFDLPIDFLTLILSDNKKSVKLQYLNNISYKYSFQPSTLTKSDLTMINNKFYISLLEELQKIKDENFQNIESETILKSVNNITDLVKFWKILNLPIFLKNEFKDWINNIKVLKEKYPQIKVFSKGGSVLGLEVFKLTINEDSTIEDFENFLNLNLIRDWDLIFHLEKEDEKYAGKNSKGEYGNLIEILTSKKKFRAEGSNTCIIRHKEKNLIKQGESLLEATLYIKKKITEYSKIEVPITSMIFEINNDNIYNFFKVITIFWVLEKTKKQDFAELKKFMLEYLVKTLTYFNIEIINSENGFVKIQSKDEIDYGKRISDKIFKSYIKNYNLNEKQFLLSIYDNAMALVRMIYKNIPKSNKLEKYLYPIKPDWILNQNIILNLLDEMKTKIFNHYEHLYLELYKDPSEENIINLFTNLDNFFSEMLIVVVFNEFNKNKSEIFKESVLKTFDIYLPKLSDEITFEKIYNQEIGMKLKKDLIYNYTFELFKKLSNLTS